MREFLRGHPCDSGARATLKQVRQHAFKVGKFTTIMCYLRIYAQRHSRHHWLSARVNNLFSRPMYVAQNRGACGVCVSCMVHPFTCGSTHLPSSSEMIITVREFPPRLGCNNRVSLLSRKGTCDRLCDMRGEGEHRFYRISMPLILLLVG